ncbi:ribonuclease D [Afifella pfennigii]|uniref:ribonuclease D n=1 Tax=Afifella pfennigii TaxID=209897 RepID=UPI00047EB2FB|nr:ribonuclease H-like domain-containing protein [Afifella pfennigii]
MTIRFHEGDLPDLSHYGEVVAVDTETMGLKPGRDRLCLVQLSPGDDSADIVRIRPGQREAPNLVGLLSDPARLKLFHYARFDVAALRQAFGVVTTPIWCTKIASKLARTYTDRHGLKDLARELLGLELSKQQQSSDWGAEELSEAQLHYAAADVLYLHAIRQALQTRLERESRLKLAEACFSFVPVRAELDLLGWEDSDIFAHA